MRAAALHGPLSPQQGLDNEPGGGRPTVEPDPTHDGVNWANIPADRLFWLYLLTSESAYRRAIKALVIVVAVALIVATVAGLVWIYVPQAHALLTWLMAAATGLSGIGGATGLYRHRRRGEATPPNPKVDDTPPSRS